MAPLQGGVMGIKKWWLSNFGSEVDHRQYIVHFGGTGRGARWVRGKKAADEYASKFLAKNEDVLWASIGPDYGGDPIRYYRDVNKSIRRLELEDGVQPWVGALFDDRPRYEPVAFVLGNDRASTVNGTKAALETNPDLKAAYVNEFTGRGMGWIAGQFTDDLTRGEHGDVVVRDLVEEQRLNKIASLKAELSELERDQEVVE